MKTLKDDRNIKMLKNCADYREIHIFLEKESANCQREKQKAFDTMREINSKTNGRLEKEGMKYAKELRVLKEHSEDIKATEKEQKEKYAELIPPAVFNLVLKLCADKASEAEFYYFMVKEIDKATSFAVEEIDKAISSPKSSKKDYHFVINVSEVQQMNFFEKISREIRDKLMKCDKSEFISPELNEEIEKYAQSLGGEACGDSGEESSEDIYAVPMALNVDPHPICSEDLFNEEVDESQDDFTGNDGQDFD